jgi:hypothetical protein
VIARYAPRPRILALDPGTTQTGVVLYDPEVSEPVVHSEVCDNVVLLNWLNGKPCARHADISLTGPHVLAVEMIASYGMPVGAEVFQTCVWIGRFIEAWGRDHTLVYRKDVKLNLCQSHKAKDTNVWAAIVDRFGGKDAAVGKKATPGPLYGVTSHARAALAVALTYCDGIGKSPPGDVEAS